MVEPQTWRLLAGQCAPGSPRARSHRARRERALRRRSAAARWLEAERRRPRPGRGDSATSRAAAALRGGLCIAGGGAGGGWAGPTMGRALAAGRARTKRTGSFGASSGVFGSERRVPSSPDLPIGSTRPRAEQFEISAARSSGVHPMPFERSRRGLFDDHVRRPRALPVLTLRAHESSPSAATAAWGCSVRDAASAWGGRCSSCTGTGTPRNFGHRPRRRYEKASSGRPTSDEVGDHANGRGSQTSCCRRPAREAAPSALPTKPEDPQSDSGHRRFGDAIASERGRKSSAVAAAACGERRHRGRSRTTPGAELSA